MTAVLRNGIFSILCALTVVAGELPIDFEKGRRADYSLQSRTDRSDSVIDPLIDWPTWYGVLQTGSINMSFDCFGRIGTEPFAEFVTIPGWPHVSFQSPPGSPLRYLWGGALWIGGIRGEDTIVTAGFDPQYINRPELYPPGYRTGNLRGAVRRIAGPADFAMRAMSIDSFNVYIHHMWPSYRGLGIRLIHRSYLWRTNATRNIVVFDVTITNTTDSAIGRAAIGLYFDPDIYDINDPYFDYFDDMVGSIRQYGIGYAVDNDGNPDQNQLPDTTSPRRAIAVKFLACSVPPSDTTFNWWTWDARHDFAPRMRGTPEYPFREFDYGELGTPGNDQDMYYLMTKPEWDYDQYYTRFIGPEDPLWLYPDQTARYDVSDGHEIKFSIAISPFDLPPDSSLRVLYAVFAPDSVIYRTDLAQIMKYLPELYPQALDLGLLVEQGEIADSLAEILLDPINPVVGVELVHADPDSVVIEWDPWVFPNVDGYEVYVTPVSPDILPHAGVVPPWLEPEHPIHETTITGLPRYTTTELDPTRQYWIQVAHRSGEQIGRLSEPLVLETCERTSAPVLECRHLFVEEEEKAILRWEFPPDTNVHHFNLYRFEDSIRARNSYHPFYDLGFSRDSLEPQDSFVVDGRHYFYYNMTPMLRVNGFTREIGVDVTSDGETFVLTAMDSLGNESAFSKPCIVRRVPARDRDILVLTYSGATDNFVTWDTIVAFYDSILMGYDHDFYNYRDSLSVEHCPSLSQSCVDWHDLMPYKLVIIDDGLRDEVPTTWWEDNTSGLRNYLASGGQLAWFGSLSSFNFLGINSPVDWVPVVHDFVRDHFAFDSIHYVGLGYFVTYETPPYEDTLFAFNRAEPVDEAPAVQLDTGRYPFTPDLSYYWPSGTPPIVSTVAPTESATVTHVYQSSYPGTSLMEGEAVGLKTDGDLFTTYLFGFHLWYMDPENARQLVDWIMAVAPGPCCIGRTGNVDGSRYEQPDINDLTTLLDYLFMTGRPLACPAEANVDADPDGIVDILDFVALVDHLYLTSVPTPECR